MDNLLRPLVDWSLRDFYDNSDIVTEHSIFNDYAFKNQNPQVYQKWFPLWLLSERLWEEEDGGIYIYWPTYSTKGIFPPLKIELYATVGNNPNYYQTIHIRDGNHRVRYWKENGFEEAPAWVLDYRNLKTVERIQVDAF
jgi:hypothetical protein